MSNYISIGKALQKLLDAGGCDASDEWARGYDAGITEAIDIIDNIPPADVAPVVHGRWSKEMRFTEDFMGNRTYGYKCSVCGKLANRLQFCGNCGAKMDESEGK